MRTVSELAAATEPKSTLFVGSSIDNKSLFSATRQKWCGAVIPMAYGVDKFDPLTSAAPFQAQNAGDDIVDVRH
jgi:hypothetical protein